MADLLTTAISAAIVFLLLSAVVATALLFAPGIDNILMERRERRLSAKADKGQGG